MLYNLPFQLPTSITGHCTHILAIANAAIAQYRNGHEPPKRDRITRDPRNDLFYLVHTKEQGIS
ncbi:unnamed protein product [Ceratitis capitata]|uniref:(Mediterranean fruit fly) hypothetical protein n=1 Tax=Ceratitis capitata TaxID=7213 RepID=A0A811UF54_CERCA|nr:unnamed protein product [Ceratitis capitata]